jgi:hypothetical protein
MCGWRWRRRFRRRVRPRPGRRRCWIGGNRRLNLPCGFDEWRSSRAGGAPLRIVWNYGKADKTFLYNASNLPHCSLIGDRFVDWQTEQACGAHDVGYDLLRYTRNFMNDSFRHTVDAMIFNLISDHCADIDGFFEGAAQSYCYTTAGVIWTGLYKWSCIETKSVCSILS